MRSTTSKLLATLALLLLSGVALAQAWPPASVRIIVPYPPGAEPDVLARDLANQLSKKTGKAFVVDNKPGANAIIGTDVVAKAEGDGSVLLMVDRLAVVTNPLLYSKLPYDWQQDLKPVTDLARVRLFVAISPALPVANYKEFVAYAKAHPNAVNVGIASNGHVNHIGMAMLAASDGMALTYVPYKGMAPTITGFLGDETSVLMAGGLVMQQLSKTKSAVKVVAVGGEQRAAFMPNVPTIAEAGGKAGSIPSTVFSFFAPGKTPNALVMQIQQAIDTQVTPEFKKSYVERGLEVSTTTPEQMRANLKTESERYTKLLRDLGIKIE
jgi:tripartite-type tricarboxylate transporter receptor subunit TctC